MTLRELTSLTGIAERQIRYLIAEGFMPPPRGGRAHADYGQDHVAAIGRYMVLRRTGLLPSAIKLLMDGARPGETRLGDSGSVPFPVAPGVALHVDPRLLGQRQDTDALIDRLRHLLVDLFPETTDAPDFQIQSGGNDTPDRRRLPPSED